MPAVVSPSPKFTEGGRTIARRSMRSGSYPRDAEGSRSLDVELEEHHVAVLHDVVAPLLADETLLSSGRHRAGGREVLEPDGLRLDEPALEIGMDHPGG